MVEPTPSPQPGARRPRRWLSELPDLDDVPPPRGARAVAWMYALVAVGIAACAIGGWRGRAPVDGFLAFVSLYAMGLAAGTSALRSKTLRPASIGVVAPLAAHALAGLAGTVAIAAFPGGVRGVTAGIAEGAMSASLFAMIAGPVVGLAPLLGARRVGLLIATLVAGALAVVPVGVLFF